MKDRDLMVYLMKENIKLRKKLRETEETSDYWFQEYRELKKRNSGNQREELARAEAQWLTVPDWEIPKQKISWEKNLYSFMAKPKSGPPSKPEE